MRARLLIVTAFLLLAACDAGNRDGERADPGGDNAFPGPQLAITTPGAGQRWAEDDAPAVVMFDLRNTQALERREGDRIHYRVDHGPIREVDDHTRPVALVASDLKPGANVVRAFVAKRDGTPYGNPGASAVRAFYIGGTGDKVDEGAAHLFVLPPSGTTIRFGVSGAHLSERSHRVHVRLGSREASLFEAGAVDLQQHFGGSAVRGSDLTIELQRLVPGAKGPVWEAVPGPFNRERIKLGS